MFKPLVYIAFAYIIYKVLYSLLNKAGTNKVDSGSEETFRVKYKFYNKANQHGNKEEQKEDFSQENPIKPILEGDKVKIKDAKFRDLE